MLKIKITLNWFVFNNKNLTSQNVFLNAIFEATIRTDVS